MRIGSLIKLIPILVSTCLGITACMQQPPTLVETPVGPSNTDLSSLLAETQNQVSTIRGLTPPINLPHTFLSPADILLKVEEEFFNDYTPKEAAKDSKSLWLLGLLPQDFALLDFYHDLYAEQINGYYDDEAQKMYVVQSGAFNIIEHITYAHEYTHALQDFHFDFDQNLSLSEETCARDSERCAAIQALIEGDASFTETLWFQQNTTKQDFLDLQNYYLNLELPIYESAPAYLRDDLTFPYSYGSQFVSQLYAQGGFEAVNRAFTESVPVSTEQILHPSRYPQDTPISVEVPDVALDLGEGWKQAETNSLGEWFIWLLLARGHEPSSRLNDLVASTAAEGWGGDKYTILTNETRGETAIAMLFVWDSPAEQQEALIAFKDWLALRFGTAQADGFYRSAEATAVLKEIGEARFQLVIADRPTTATSLMELLHE